MQNREINSALKKFYKTYRDLIEAEKGMDKVLEHLKKEGKYSTYYSHPEAWTAFEPEHRHILNSCIESGIVDKDSDLANNLYDPDYIGSIFDYT